MVFSENPGLMRGYEHAIKMRNATPFHKANYPIPLKHRPEAQLQIRAKVEKKRLKYLRSIKPILFRPNDLVLVKTHPLSSAGQAEIKKFFNVYEGPRRVVSKVNSNCYQIADLDGRVLGNQNIVNLKPYKSAS